MKKIATCLIFSSSLISPIAAAQWQSKTFESGQLIHHLARSHTTNRDSLEIFCTSKDLRPSLAVYFTNQRFGRRKAYDIKVQIDQNHTIALASFRHAMAFTAPAISDVLLEQLAAGNYATVSYTNDLEKPKSLRISLRGSSKAIDKMMENCRLDQTTK